MKLFCWIGLHDRQVRVEKIMGWLGIPLMWRNVGYCKRCRKVLVIGVWRSTRLTMEVPRSFYK